MGTDKAAVVEQATENSSTVHTAAVEAEAQLKEQVRLEIQGTQEIKESNENLAIDKKVASVAEESVTTIEEVDTVTELKESSLAAAAESEAAVQEVQTVQEIKEVSLSSVAEGKSALQNV